MKKQFIFLLFKKLGINAVEIQYNKTIDFNIEKDLMTILKKNQFIETTTDGWRKGFVCVLITKDKVFIKHNIENNKLTLMHNPLLTIDSWINYFERI